MTGEVSRKALRHELLRLRNARVARLRDDREPLLVAAHPDTITELLIDSDPHEHLAMDFEGKVFMGVPLHGDPRLPAGVFEVSWPDAPLGGPPAPDGPPAAAVGGDGLW